MPQKRCERFGARGRFVQARFFDGSLDELGPFDAAALVYVLHHVVDPAAFVERQVELLLPGGVLVVNDHVTDPALESPPAITQGSKNAARPDPHAKSDGRRTGGPAGWRAGLSDVSLVEDRFVLDFDEWFDRGTPGDTKSAVRAAALASGPLIRSFHPHLLERRFDPDRRRWRTRSRSEGLGVHADAIGIACKPSSP